MDSYFAEVYERATDKVVKRLGPFGERKAWKVCDGMTINLNYDKYGSRVVQPDEDGMLEDVEL